MPLIPTISIGRKYERDIDLLLAEEFAVSPDFACWFLTQTKSFRDIQARVASVCVSKSDSTGESDIVVIYRIINDSNSFAILIEDKVNAIFQPQQLERYRLRAFSEMAKAKPDYSQAEIVVCAPKSYGNAHAEQIGTFDAFVPYESIATFFRSRHEDAGRYVYKADFIESACDVKITSNTTVYDDVTNRFWNNVFKIANADFPELGMKSSKYASGTAWVTFRPRGMPSLPKAVRVEMKGKLGVVDLTFNNTLCAEMQPVVKRILDDGMQVHQTGGATALRLCVDPFTVCENFEDMRKPVVKALAAGVQLVNYYFKNQAFLDEVAAKATPLL